VERRLTESPVTISGRNYPAVLTAGAWWRTPCVCSASCEIIAITARDAALAQSAAQYAHGAVYNAAAKMFFV